MIGVELEMKGIKKTMRADANCHWTGVATPPDREAQRLMEAEHGFSMWWIAFLWEQLFSGLPIPTICSLPVGTAAQPPISNFIIVSVLCSSSAPRTQWRTA